MKIQFKEIRLLIKKYIHLCRALLKDQETPKIAKILLWLALGYIFMPFDLIPDFIPGIGQLDDVIIVPGLIFLAFKCIPENVYQKHKQEIFKNLKQ